MAVPFIGRLHPMEYLTLVVSFCIVALEAILRIFTLALPSFLVSYLYRASRRLFLKFSSAEDRRANSKTKCTSDTIRDAADFVELCHYWGYEAEEHIVQTKDGYLLGLHRLQWRHGEECQNVNSGANSIKKRVVYMHHGLLMNSEVWVCQTDKKRCLAFELVNQGFDVWFGNNRGNKYSKKSIHSSPNSARFWDFSIDEFAFYDIPDSIEYILDSTQQKSLSYIGFSQGTAQAFATLAIHPKLNHKVNVFIALAPAMAPAGLSNGVVDSLMKASPSSLYLMFGRRSILSSATFWETIMYPPIFTRTIDMGLSFLFNWKTLNISSAQKFAAYPHLYSFTSTKSVVHWFQIIRNRSFQLYDDNVHQPMSVSNTRKFSKMAKYPTRNIRTPVVLVYGGSDSLVDINSMLRELPPQTVATEIPHYEHLDFLWARDVNVQVFQHVFDALESFTDAEHTAEEYDRYHAVRCESLIGSGFLGDRQDAISGDASISGGGKSRNSLPFSQPHRAREPMPRPCAATVGSPPLRRAGEPARKSEPLLATTTSPRKRVSAGGDAGGSSDKARTPPSPRDTETATATDKLRGVGVRREPSLTGLNVSVMRDGRGISLGQANAVGGVVTGTAGVERADVVSSSGEERKGDKKADKKRR